MYNTIGGAPAHTAAAGPSADLATDYGIQMVSSLT
jgi:hypothetical protein